ncbi:hypothetical protein BDN70DRAFT_882561 [Pholiota conissans]|uniref:Uncharacterized protein n=1 Tax=Pholiota conissans TaxID=109636 RepID=A0A9P6CXK2_9AGAR|nr:hypothetical protein BDN70DRAFT_882561 [Pholiota conissans]
MYRSQAIRLIRISAKPSIVPFAATRAYNANTTSQPQPPTQPPRRPAGPDNTLLYGLLALGAAGGAYLYFKNPDDVKDMKERAHREVTELKQKGKDAADDVKEKADTTLQSGEAKYDKFKAESKETIDAGKASAQTRDANLRREGRSIGEDIESKYSTARDATRGNLSRARDSTERYYNEARESVDHKTTEAREAADRKAHEAKQSWYSWLGWGKSKAEKGAHMVESEADRVKREAAEKVAEAAHRVGVRAEKSA